MGVEHVLKVISDVGDVGVAVVQVMKGDFMERLVALTKVASEVGDIVANVKEVLPELKDLDASEVAAIGAMSYTQVKRVVDALQV